MYGKFVMYLGLGRNLNRTVWLQYLMCDVWIFVRSTFSLVFVLMYPTVERAGYSPSAQVSLIMSCAVFC